MKKEKVTLKFEVSIYVPYSYDPKKYYKTRNRKVEAAIKKWISAKNIKSSITNGFGSIPFYVEKDEDGSTIEETTGELTVYIDNIYEV